jgi:hypothetical protein
MMNDTRTASILQRVPVILAVTAASYGLPLDGRGGRARSAGKPSADAGAQRGQSAGGAQRRH